MPSTPITLLPQIGEKRAKLFQKLGIFNIEDLLRYYPRGYEDRSVIKPISQATEGDTVCIRGTALTVLRHSFVRKGMTTQKLSVGDGTGVAFLTWFNQPWLKTTVDLSAEYLFFGKASIKNGRLEMANPLFERADKLQTIGRVMPLYPLTAQLTQKIVQQTVEHVLPYASLLPEPLPPSMLESEELCTIEDAIQNIHFPQDAQKQRMARHRLAFEELLFLQLGLRLIKSRRVERKGTSIPNTSSAQKLIQSLPFSLTHAQKRVTEEILKDLQAEKPMNRLVQGDVGCGKTVVAAIAMQCVAANNMQAAMMAPTELLAKQHYETLCALLEGSNVRIDLLTGSHTAAQKREIVNRLKTGQTDIVVGTHALIQEKVEFHRLALVVTDEQHRFGVRQRAALAEKGVSPHLLVMTATPIPRTLALILYGDLDISVIDELPPGRKPVETYPVDESMRQRIYNFLHKQIEQGRQAYIVCPLVEESDASELKSVTEYAKQLQQKVFPHAVVELLHGKLRPKQKNEIMERFQRGEIHILVSTTVIEVGVNVPNANIMVIENAERFGLSQLHQLRGRVGRGEWQSYCILFCQGGTDVTKQRMDIMKQTNDGFLIAEKDLELRGPGEFFGTRQHGVPELKIANLYTDMDLIARTGKIASDIVAQDETLQCAQNSGLRSKILQMFGENDIFNWN